MRGGGTVQVCAFWFFSFSFSFSFSFFLSFPFPFSSSLSQSQIVGKVLHYRWPGGSREGQSATQRLGLGWKNKKYFFFELQGKKAVIAPIPDIVPASRVEEATRRSNKK